MSFIRGKTTYWRKNSEPIGAAAPYRFLLLIRHCIFLYFLKLLKRSGLSTDDLLCFYKSVILIVLEYGSVVWHYRLTRAQSNKLEALQKRAFRIILHPLTLPYITALGYLKLDSLKHCRMEADEQFFETTFPKLIVNLSPLPFSTVTWHSTCNKIAARKNLSNPTH